MSLTVETALESFSFLNTSDLEDEEEDCERPSVTDRSEFLIFPFNYTARKRQQLLVISFSRRWDVMHLRVMQYCHLVAEQKLYTVPL